jgi:hypothetical protein
MFDKVCCLGAIRTSDTHEDKLSVYEKPVVDDSVVTSEVPAPALADAPAPISAAADRFRSCRWRKVAEDATPECCGHRDVLPLTGAHGFDSAAWCPECAFYKLRRTPKKRDYYGERY